MRTAIRLSRLRPRTAFDHQTQARIKQELARSRAQVDARALLPQLFL
jgi:hypothetical protein